MGYTDGYIRKLKKGGEALLDALPADVITDSLPAWYLRDSPERPSA